MTTQKKEHRSSGRETASLPERLRFIAKRESGTDKYPASDCVASGHICWHAADLLETYERLLSKERDRVKEMETRLHRAVISLTNPLENSERFSK